jgi:predicted ester cyclase
MGNNPQKYYDILDENHVYYTPVCDTQKGKQATVDLDKVVNTAFPNLKYLVNDLVVQGDKVAMRSIFRGIFTGKFMNFEPTGKQVISPRITIFRFKGDKIIETRANRDS